MSKLIEFIDNVSPPVLADKLLWLDNPRTVYFIKSGALDIFLQAGDFFLLDYI